jgi:hypothetical protein
MVSERLGATLVQLYRGTNEGKLRWKKLEQPDWLELAVGPAVFQLGRVRDESVGTPGGAIADQQNWIVRLLMLNEDRSLLDRVSEHDVVSQEIGGFTGDRLMQALYCSARETALDLDKVLDSVMAAVDERVKAEDRH